MPIGRISYLCAPTYVPLPAIKDADTKKQQMRWCDEGAHHLALVRVADLNGELTARTFGRITQPRRRVVDWLYHEPMDLAA
jgi:hypothetical protein